MATSVQFTIPKGEVSMSDTYWLTVTNIALGAITLVCCIAVGIGVLQEVARRRKKVAALSKLDSEVADLVATFDGHAFNVPGLGVTMADGGEELRKKEER
jgi:hypothetical protein